MKRTFQLIDKNFFLDKFGGFFGKKKLVKRAKELPLITISRETGSGGRVIADLVAKELGRPWKVYHKEIVDEIAKEAHLEKALIEEVDDSNIPFIDKLVADFFGRRYLNLPTYNKHLVKILSTIGQRGYVIIIGRGANFLFPHALKVRIICEMEQRIKWVMEYKKITSRCQAVEFIQNSDKRRGEFSQVLFHHNIRKAHHYDLIIRIGENLSLQDAAHLIVCLAKRRFKIRG